MPQVGFVYETTLGGATVMLCIHVREITILKDLCYDFLVLDGDGPDIRTWSGSQLSSFPMNLIMTKYRFKRIV
jgi:hypothetical protein